MGFGCGGSSWRLKDIKDQTYVFMLNFDFILKQAASKKGLKRRTSQKHLALFVLTELLSHLKIQLIVVPQIVSGETILIWIWPYVLWPLLTVHKSAETIQKQKLFAEIRYANLLEQKCVMIYSLKYEISDQSEILPSQNFVKFFILTHCWSPLVFWNIH